MFHGSQCIQSCESTPKGKSSREELIAPKPPAPSGPAQALNMSLLPHPCSDATRTQLHQPRMPRNAQVSVMLPLVAMRFVESRCHVLRVMKQKFAWVQISHQAVNRIATPSREVAIKSRHISFLPRESEHLYLKVPEYSNLLMLQVYTEMLRIHIGLEMLFDGR